MNTEVTKLENVRKSCKTASIVLKVIKIICIVFLIISTAGAAVCLGLSAKINNELIANPEVADSISVSFNFGPVELTDLATDMMDAGEYASVFMIACIIVAIALALAAITFSMIEKIFLAVLKNDSPFNDAVIKTMKKTFIFITILMLLSEGLGAAFVFAMLFWCIYTIFQYGAELQKESDETL